MIRFALWRVWNRTRFYWPQAKSRRRALANLRDGVEQHGVSWETYRRDVGLRRRPWWLP